MRYRLIVFMFAAICATSVFGQNSTNITSGPAGFSGSAHFGALPGFGGRAVTGAPYSGEEVNEQVQTLADGTHITRKGVPTKVYRDSLGRTRTERPIGVGLAFAGAGRMPDSPVMVEITDPVAQVKYTLDTVNKVAHRQQLPAAPDIPARQAANSAVQKAVVAGGSGLAGGGGVASGNILSARAPSEVTRPQMTRPQMTNEKLGIQTVEGVLAEGTRSTQIWPVDSQGNDRPISVVSETWMSVDLKVMVMSKTNDPRSGENTHKLTNISLGEPSASLFQAPPDYSVVDEAGEFTIKWGSQQ